jgi:hypothetical protein
VAAAIAEVLRIAAPPAPVAVDQAALAEAEAAYAAHRAGLVPAERAAVASPSTSPMGTVYHPDTPLEPTPSMSLAAWMTNGQPEPSRS